MPRQDPGGSPHHPDFVFTGEDRKVLKRILILVEGLEQIPQTLLDLLNHIHEMEHRIMATVQEALDAVTATKGKVDSLEVLVKQLHDIIVAMPTGGLTPEQQAAVDQIKALSDTEATEVQAAIDANQPPTP